MGQNLAIIWSTAQLSPDDATFSSRIQNWFNEVRQYAWGSGWAPKTGHYSQVSNNFYKFCAPATKPFEEEVAEKSVIENLTHFSFICFFINSWYGVKPTWLDADSHTIKMLDVGISCMCATMDQGNDQFYQIFIFNPEKKKKPI